MAGAWRPRPRPAPAEPGNQAMVSAARAIRPAQPSLHPSPVITGGNHERKHRPGAGTAVLPAAAVLRQAGFASPEIRVFGDPGHRGGRLALATPRPRPCRSGGHDDVH